LLETCGLNVPVEWEGSCSDNVRTVGVELEVYVVVGSSKRLNS